MNEICYRNLHFPPSIIQRAVWLYSRFNLSLRDVEELLAERGVQVSYETIRRWMMKFGPEVARRLNCDRPRPHPLWHLDEMYVSIGGRWMYLWRAVDQNGKVLDVLVQAKRDKWAALKLMRKLLKKHGFAPRTLVTDKWRAYGAAFPRTQASPLGITRRNGRTTASKDRTSRSDGESEPCKGSEVRDQPNASSQSTLPSIITSPPDDISYQLPSIVTVVIKLSRRGALPPAPLPDGMLRWA